MSNPGFDPTLGSLPNAGPATSTQPKPARHRPPAPTPAGQPPPPRALDSCDICAATPTAQFRFQQQIGVVFASIDSTRAGQFCSDCAKSVGREAQNISVAVGWFGLLAFITNCLKIIANTKFLRRASNLAPPSPPTASTLEPGRPILLRGGLLVPLAVVAFVAFVILSSL